MYGDTLKSYRYFQHLIRVDVGTCRISSIIEGVSFLQFAIMKGFSVMTRTFSNYVTLSLIESLISPPM